MKGRLLLLAVLTVAGSAGAAQAQVPAGDSVTGAGTARFVSAGLEGLTVPFAIDVRGGPSGENPTGSVSLLLTFTDPSCLAVRDGGGAAAPTAAMNLVNPITGQRVVIQIGGGESGPQLIALFAADSPSDCSFRTSPTTLAEVISGSIAIVDAPPRPTSKGQCKNGGWRNFGALFRSQGDCVSFVTKGSAQ
jgi:hypothetical protein